MEKKIDVISLMIVAAIPLVVTPLYAFYRIKKFKKGVLVILAVIAFDILFLTSNGDIIWEEEYVDEEIYPILFTYGMATTLVVDILVPMYFARKWTIEYNEHPVSLQQTSIADEISKLAKLKEEGVLTDQEFQTKKAELLGRS